MTFGVSGDCFQFLSLTPPCFEDPSRPWRVRSKVGCKTVPKGWRLTVKDGLTRYAQTGRVPKDPIWLTGYFPSHRRMSCGLHSLVCRCLLVVYLDSEHFDTFAYFHFSTVLCCVITREVWGFQANRGFGQQAWCLTWFRDLFQETQGNECGEGDGLKESFSNACDNVGRLLGWRILSHRLPHRLLSAFLGEFFCLMS